MRFRKEWPLFARKGNKPVRIGLLNELFKAKDCHMHCTFLSPELLKNLLGNLKQQECTYNFDIIVADNDKLGSAKHLVHFFSENVQYQVKYLIDPQQNISLTRNKAVDASNGELIAFIDDDEIPSPDWLSLLTECFLKNNAEAVLGPVVPLLPTSSPSWLWKSGYFEPLEIMSVQHLTQATSAGHNTWTALCSTRSQKIITKHFFATELRAVSVMGQHAH